jgi:hypothetical protein
MNINELLQESRRIWGHEKSSLSEIIVRMGKVFGDICRYERDAPKDKAVHTKDELQKELGNILFSTIRWCDDLGLDPEACIKKAIDCQEKFKK